MTPNPLHDPSYPVGEMCQICLEYPVGDSHDCEPPEPVGIAPWLILIGVVVLDGILGWAIWTGIHYTGWIR